MRDVAGGIDEQEIEVRVDRFWVSESRDMEFLLDRDEPFNPPPQSAVIELKRLWPSGCAGLLKGQEFGLS
jgi:hypothetical protein